MAGTTDNSISQTTATAKQSVGNVVSYHERLNQDARWALSEGSLFFEGKGKMQEALRRITSRLNELGIPYAVVGGMALFRHGYRRFTEDVDLLVTRESLKQIHAKLEGLGYVRPFANSKNLRDTDAGVRVEFLIAGDYPGDGKPKPVAFPDPAEKSVEIEGMKVLGLASIVELKLASGMTSPHRIRDLADVQDLAKHIKLPLDFEKELNPYVREKFVELCSGVTPADIEAEGPNSES